MGKLTAKLVASLSEPGRYSDGDGSGFHLRVDAQGRKYWILRVQGAGGRRDIAIGSVKRMTLAVARERARSIRLELDDRGSTRVMPTFAEAARGAHKARMVGYRNQKHVAQWLSTLETNAFPMIGDKPIGAVDRADVVRVLDPIWLKVPETARRVLQRIDRVIRWAIGNGFREHGIDMALVRDALPRQPHRRTSVRRMPSIDWAEAPDFYRRIPNSPSAPEIRLGLAFLMLTAVRPGNIRSANRAQFSPDLRTWTIPAEQMKGGLIHRVPLSPAAAEIVQAVLDMHDHELLFSTTGAPMSLDTLRMMMRRMGRDETPHGFRSTFKEWARSNGWSDDLSETALAHVDPNEVRAAYARSDLLEERRPMMVAWAAYLAGKTHSPAAPQPE